MKRRDFILVTISASLAFNQGCLRRNRSDGQVAGVSPPMFLTIICDDKELLAIGEAYLNQHPEEASKDNLASLLPTASLLSTRIQTDFQTGNTVVVKGWVLSLTEARQCALYSLSR